MREAARARLEGCLDRAVECVKRRTRVRDYSDAMRELRTAVDFNRWGGREQWTAGRRGRAVRADGQFGRAAWVGG